MEKFWKLNWKKLEEWIYFLAHFQYFNVLTATKIYMYEIDGFLPRNSEKSR